MPFRVTLINDDEVTSRGLTSMLGEHPDVIELVRMSGPILDPIDIALYDVVANGPGKGPTINQLLADSRIRKVAVYTWNFQPWSAVDLLEQGASAYLSKSLSSTELVTALQSVHEGQTIISPAARTHHRSQTRGAEHGEELTEREAEVLSLISTGLTNAEIADHLRLSLNSVKSYIRTGYRKIDVDSRTKAVIWGLAHGLGPSTLYDKDTHTGEPSTLSETDHHHERARVSPAVTHIPAPPARMPAAVAAAMTSENTLTAR